MLELYCCFQSLLPWWTRNPPNSSSPTPAPLRPGHCPLSSSAYSSIQLCPPHISPSPARASFLNQPDHALLAENSHGFLNWSRVKSNTLIWPTGLMGVTQLTPTASMLQPLPEHSGPQPQALVSESFCCSVTKLLPDSCDPMDCIAH